MGRLPTPHPYEGLPVDWWPFKVPKPLLPDAGQFQPLLNALVQHCERLYWAGVWHGSLTTAVVLIILYAFLHRKKP